MGQGAHRDAYFAYHGKGPYPCWLCKAPIVYLTGPWPESLAVHHIDFNPSNNDIANLAAMHSRCHHRWHATLHAAGRAPGP